MKKIISVLLMLALMFSLTSTCAFADEDENAEQEHTVAILDNDSIDSDFEEKQPEGNTTDITETPEEPDVQDDEAQEEKAPENDEPGVELPFGFIGMGEGYELSQEQLDQKAALTEKGVPETLELLTGGVDYEEGVLMFLADTEEYALQVARAYNAELVELNYGVAIIKLKNNTVVEAVRAAADITVPLPAVDPNYISRLEDPSEAGMLMTFSNSYAMSEKAPIHQTWQNWFDNAQNPDEFLSYPNNWDENCDNWHDYQWMHEYVDSFGAWGVSMGDGIVVGVIDTGVDASHPDLSGKVKCIDIGYGTQDDDGHGTHVVGIIAATADNGIGGAGIAPKATILSFRAGNEGYFEDADIAKAINAAVSNGCRIINLSLGGPGYNSTVAVTVRTAISKNVTIIASAGNDSSNIINYPASYPGVISVASTDSAGVLSTFTDWGSQVDIAAPGTDIISTASGDGYEVYSGTSMAAPVVTGVAALYMSKMGCVSPAEMEKALKASVTKVANSEVKFGIVNAGNLFSADKTAPMVSVYDEYGDYVTKPASGVTLNSSICLEFGSNAQDNSHIIIYTTDGSTPGVLNGEIINGKKYEGPFTPADVGLLDGDSIKIVAATVSGIGVISKMTKLNAKVLPSSMVGTITVIAPERAIPGGKVPLSAVVGPEGCDQTVLWSLEYLKVTGGGTATINDKGILAIPASFTGTIKVTATSNRNAAVSNYAIIAVEPLAPVASIKIDKAYTLKISDNVKEKLTLKPEFTLKDGTVLRYGDEGYDAVSVKWTSGNKKTAAVNYEGNEWVASAVSKGSVTLSCSTLDGSGKKVSTKITVVRLADSITITGQAAIASGNKATFKATVQPSTANNRKVVWSLQGAPYGVNINSSGAVTVPKGTPQTSFEIVAESADGAATARKTVSITSTKATAVQLGLEDYNYTADFIYNSKGALTSVTLLTCDPVATKWKNTEAQLVSQVSGAENIPVIWSSSNTKVVRVDQSGRITAVSSGKAQIICTADDGSGKKATVSVTVYIPASSVSVSPVGMPSDDSTCFLAFGKAKTFKASLGCAYGKPTVQKVNWDFELFDREWNDNSEQYDWFDCTDYAKEKKLITISSSGKLTVNKKLMDDWLTINGNYVVYVKAETTDGSWISGETEVVLTRPTTELSLHDFYYSWKDELNYYYNPIKSCRLPTRENDFWLLIMSDGWYESFTVSSSNPNVCGAVFEYDEDENASFIRLVAGEKKGNATITVTANDGTNKKTSLKVTVY